MQTTGRGSNEREGHGVDNVVKFPRDWIGPPEALVPFGPAADREEADREVAFGPDAFWTEDAASLHEVIQAPSGPSGSVAALQPPAPRADQVRWWRVGEHRLALAGMVAVLCLAFAAVVALQGHRVGPAQLEASVAHVGASPASGGSVLSAREARMLISRSLDARSERALSRRPRVAVRHAHHRVRPAARKTPSSAPVTEISYSASPSLSGASDSASSSTSGVSPPSVGTGTTSSSSGAASSSSGPVGPAAPFGPGQMGPG